MRQFRKVMNFKFSRPCNDKYGETMYKGYMRITYWEFGDKVINGQRAAV